MKKIILLLLSLAFIIIVGILLWILFLGKSGKQSAPQLPPVAVTTASVQQQLWQDKTRSTGSLSAVNGIMVKAETSGRVTKIFSLRRLCQNRHSIN